MRESRTYGSVRRARDETRVPTATEARVHHVARRRRRVAGRGARAADSDVFVAPDGFFTSRRVQLAALAARHALAGDGAGRLVRFGQRVVRGRPELEHVLEEE